MRWAVDGGAAAIKAQGIAARGREGLHRSAKSIVEFDGHAGIIGAVSGNVKVKVHPARMYNTPREDVVNEAGGKGADHKMAGAILISIRRPRAWAYFSIVESLTSST